MGLFGLGFQEFLWLVVIIVVLNSTGLWPRIIRGLSDLRGDTTPEPDTSRNTGGNNLDMCYRLLGISPTAPWDEIERAYRAKAKKHHPDHGGDEDAMRALNEAYALLKKARRTG